MLREDLDLDSTKPAYQTIGGGTAVHRGGQSVKGPGEDPTLVKISGRDLEILCLLGRGDSGRVYLARRSAPTVKIPNAPEGSIFALKVYSQHDLKQRNKEDRFRTEQWILRVSKHRNIVTLYAGFADERNLYLLMEFCNGGEFADLIKRQPKRVLPESVVQYYAMQLVDVLEHLHENKIIYRDLKTENVLLQGDGTLRLIDFDLAKKFEGELSYEKLSSKPQKKKTTSLSESFFGKEATSFVGTPEYLPPEMDSSRHTQSVDWWTLGIFMYECLYGRTPFAAKGDTLTTLLAKIKRGIFTFPDSKDVRVSRQCKDIIKKLLNVDPIKRLGGRQGRSEVILHPFFRKYNSAVMKPPENIVRNAVDLTKGGAMKPDEIDIEVLRRNFTIYSDEMRVIAQDFAGTDFKLPSEAQEYVPRMLKYYAQANLPMYPKPTMFFVDGLSNAVADLASATITAARGVGNKPTSKLTSLFVSPEETTGTKTRSIDDLKSLTTTDTEHVDDFCMRFDE
ncbi:Kinase, AGC [Giardia muris]|uniref:non-specific serine/threonine protein kinase n=1 Tax=Giardia muris TaxID=5742 RepID=A0A4Z1T7K0_GIAMU|nr:Kinase, AGC [Giardia muris]|eukprot:TNJ30063.1 Kinase, AGC [Giardia muris]